MKDYGGKNGSKERWSSIHQGELSPGLANYTLSTGTPSSSRISKSLISD